MPEIDLKRVVKNYGAGTNAVDNIDLYIEDGDFMCLLGPSGCGKTTTVRMIAGLENITDGTLMVGGQAVDEPKNNTFVAPEKRNIGLVFQNYALWPHLTVFENVEYGLKLRKLPKSDRALQVRSMMDKLGIAQYGDRYPAQLSGGQQQRVALARMLAVNPGLLLLDEPLSNLDSRLRLEMRAELKRIHKEYGATVVFVTHDQWEAMTLATRVAVMDQGILQQVGRPMDIYDRPVNRFVANFLGTPPINFIETKEPSPQSAIVQNFLARRVNDPTAVGSVGVRPESLMFRAPGSDSDGADTLILPGHIESVMPTGGSWTVETIVGSQRIYGTALQRGELRAGDDIILTATAKNIHVFDQDNKRMEIQC